MVGVARQIIGSFEDIGKDVIKEVASVPKDVLGKALESIGTSSSNKQGQSFGTTQDQQTGKTKEGALGQLDAAKDEKTKKAIARAALTQLAGGRPTQKEPSVWERIQKEKEEKNVLAQRQSAHARFSQLPKITQARKPGDLYGIQAKKAGSEMSKNVRQD